MRSESQNGGQSLTDALPLSRRIATMFGRIAPGYDRANRLLSGGLDVLWRKAVAAELRGRFPDSRGLVLVDLAAGTMDLSLELARRLPQATILALDLSLPMLRVGQAKCAGRGKRSSARINPVVADAFALPLPDGSADALTCAFGLRNMTPRGDALKELCRVLKPAGAAWILEFGPARQKLWGGLYNLYLHRMLPVLGGMVAGDRAAYSYLARTIRDFPTAVDLAGELQAAGFSRVFSRSLCGGIVFLHLAGK